MSAEPSTAINLRDKLSSPSAEVIGWDIGGANIKAARWRDEGWQVVQQPFAIWQRRDELTAVIAAISAGNRRGDACARRAAHWFIIP